MSWIAELQQSGLKYVFQKFVPVFLSISKCFARLRSEFSVEQESKLDMGGWLAVL